MKIYFSLQVVLSTSHFTAYRHLGVAISITSVYHNLPHNKHLSTENHPYFDIDDSGNTNLTVIQGENAYFVCIVRNLGNNSISFLRHKDVNLLSVGKYVYTQDPRYQIFHNANNDTWTMKVSILFRFYFKWKEGKDVILRVGKILSFSSFISSCEVSVELSFR